MKRLIVCCDGTWNTANQESGGVPTPTNVRKLYNALAETDRDGNEQRRYYHPGVGTEGNAFARVTGGAYGRGISSNVKSGYEWLGRNFEPGDEIYLFGFSRGAFTVRSLAGMIGSGGLVDLEGVESSKGWDYVDAIYDEGYRKQRGHQPDGARFHEVGDSKFIKLIGAWDTVGALGIPNDLEVLNLFDDPTKWAFHDLSLGHIVHAARHAVALDERRSSFTPTLWDEDARVRQIWFPGVHSDVGGGYAETGLSDGALRWMIEESDSLGLNFNQWMVDAIRPDPSGVMHDSFSGMFKALRSRPRAIPAITPDAEGETLHASALLRQAQPPINQAPYRSTKLLAKNQSEEVHVYARDRWGETSLYLEAGRYKFKASGEWLDASIRCGPGGASDGNFQAGEIVHVVSSAWGRLEGLVNRVRGEERENWDFILTKRIEELDWFSLVGAVGNDDGERNPDSDGSPRPHQIFGIGEGTELTLENSGYLYAFANDAWGKYDNNRGKVTMTVTRLS